MKCSIEKYHKEINGEKKTYLRCHLEGKNKKSFDFAIKPMFLSKKAYATLMNMVEENEK